MATYQYRIILNIEPLRSGAGQQHFLKLFISPNDKTGVFSPVKFANVNECLLGRQFLSPQDYEIVAKLTPYCSALLGDGVPLTASLSGKVIDELLALGKLYYCSHFDQALRQGAARLAQPEWRNLKDGLQSASLSVVPEAAEILATRAPRYLDFERNEVGEAKTSLDAGILEQWLRLPVIGAMKSVSPEIKSLLVKYGLPLPKSSLDKAPAEKPISLPEATSFSLRISGPDLASQADSQYALAVSARVNGEIIDLIPLLKRRFAQSEIAAVDKVLERSSLELSDSKVGRFSIPKESLEALFPLLRNLSEYEQIDGGASVRLSAADTLPFLERDLGPKWERAFSQSMLEIGKLRSKEPVLPSAFAGTLREYQRHGVSWLQLLGGLKLGGILADDMGLGKTVQILAHLAIEKAQNRQAGPHLIVCPKSVLPNWESEIRRFVAYFSLLVVKDRSTRKDILNVNNYDLVLTSYPRISRDIDLFARNKFDYIILDESQYIKNRQAAISGDVCRLNAERKLCLSGTPIENNLGDLWTQFHFVLPQLLGSYKDFERRFRVPIEVNDCAAAKIDLKARTSAFILRRVKDEVAPDLPQLNEIVQLVELTQAQRSQYQNVAKGALGEFRQRIKTEGLAPARIFIFRLILKLRQICCDPRLFASESSAEESAKLQLLIDKLLALRAERRRALVFSQFTSMLDLIEMELKERAFPYVRLDGSTKDRELPVRIFQQGETPVFLISLRAGGAGLNLTAADTVIHYDPWWNPAVGEQATARAHRIGQAKPVFAYHLLATNTIEERVRSLQQRKRDIAGSVISSRDAANAQLTEADIEFLFAE